MKHNSFIEKLTHSILFGRFEPIETVLSSSAIAHGLWLVFPRWQLLNYGVSVTSAPRASEITIAMLLMLVGTVHLASLLWGWHAVHRQTAFVSFLLWVFISYLAILSSGFSSVLPLAYTTITLVSAIIYLNVSLGYNVDVKKDA